MPEFELFGVICSAESAPKDPAVILFSWTSIILLNWNTIGLILKLIQITDGVIIGGKVTLVDISWTDFGILLISYIKKIKYFPFKCSPVILFFYLSPPFSHPT